MLNQITNFDWTNMEDVESNAMAFIPPETNENKKQFPFSLKANIEKPGSWEIIFN